MDNKSRPLSVGEWMLTIIVLGIPVVNVIMYLVWAFGDGNVNRRNFCRASIYLFLIVMGLYILLFGLVGSASLFFAVT